VTAEHGGGRSGVHHLLLQRVLALLRQEQQVADACSVSMHRHHG
jgi:hypothetical protein